MQPSRPSFLRKCRKDAVMTTRALGAAVGMRPQHLTRIEYGKATCGELIARRLAEVFKMDWKLFLSEKYNGI